MRRTADKGEVSTTFEKKDPPENRREGKLGYEVHAKNLIKSSYASNNKATIQSQG